MGCVGDAAGFAERREHRDGSEDRDAEPRRHPEHDQQNRALRKIDRVGEQQPVNCAGRANDVDVLQLTGERERQQREQHGEQSGADARNEVELQEIPRAPRTLQLSSEHPEREHVEHDVEDTTV